MMDSMRRSMMGGVRDARERSEMFDSNVSMERGEDGFVVFADVPGFEKDEIDLRFEEGVLHLAATHEVSGEAGGISASRSRQVRESIRVPGDVIVEDISASYRNGVLEVHLPVEGPAVDDDSTRIDIE